MLTRREALLITGGAFGGRAMAAVCSAAKPKPGFSIPGFEELDCKTAGIEHRLYKSKSKGPAVFICHELPGLYKEDICLAERIANFGFTSYVPLFFGKPGDYSLVRFGLSQCANPWSEFACSLPGSSRAVNWLLPLLDEAFTGSGGKGVGVIGMCLTGAFPLALMASKVLRAAVVCQPTSPLFFKSRLDLSTDQQEAARSSNIEVLGLKFSEDPKSPDARWNTMRELLGGRLFESTIDSSHHKVFGPRKTAHSILADAYDKADGSPTRKAFELVVRFLDNRLSDTPTHPPFPQAGEACPSGFKIFNNQPC